jgi:integrase
MAIRKIRQSWWVDFTLDGTRYRKRSPDNSRAGAQNYEIELRQRVRVGVAEFNKVGSIPTFEKFASSWFEGYVVPNNKYQEARMKRYILHRFLMPFFGKLDIDEIAAYHIEQFKAQCLKDGAARKTINNRLAVLSKCLNTAYEWLRLSGTPPKIRWLKCPPPRTDHLSADECTLLLSHASGVLSEMILTALRTGLRQGELRGLQWSSINWESRTLAVRHSLCDRTKQLESPKNNRERIIPLDVDVYELLHRRKKAQGYVFVDAGGQPFAGHRVIRRLRTIRKRAKLRNFSWHTLRHTFASHLAATGVPLHIVQALLGHSTITMTMRYAHVAPSTLRFAIDMLNPKTAVLENLGQHSVNKWSEQHHKRIGEQSVVA